MAGPFDVSTNEAERRAAIQRALAAAFARGYKVLYNLDDSADYKNFMWAKRLRGCAPLFLVKNDIDDRDAVSVGAIVKYTYNRSPRTMIVWDEGSPQ